MSAVGAAQGSSFARFAQVLDSTLASPRGSAHLLLRRCGKCDSPASSAAVSISPCDISCYALLSPRPYTRAVHIFDLLSEWAFFAVGLPPTIVGLFLLADEVKAFRAARVCFWIAALWVWGRIMWWGMHSPDGFLSRAIAIFLACGLVGVGLAEILRLTTRREAQTIHGEASPTVTHSPAIPPQPLGTNGRAVTSEPMKRATSHTRAASGPPETPKPRTTSQNQEPVISNDKSVQRSATSETPMPDVHEQVTSGRLASGWTLHKRRDAYSCSYLMNTDGMSPALLGAIDRADVPITPELSKQIDALWQDVRSRVPAPKLAETPYGTIQGQELVEHVSHNIKQPNITWTYEIMLGGNGITPQPQVFKNVLLSDLSESSRNTISELNDTTARAINKRYVDALVKVSK
jgi:hypothetical protein